MSVKIKHDKSVHCSEEEVISINTRTRWARLKSLFWYRADQNKNNC